MTSLLYWTRWIGVRQVQRSAATCHRLTLQISSGPPPLPKQKGRRPTSKLRQYVLSRYMQFVHHYENVLEKKFPSAMHVYRIFRIGIKEFYRDLKSFFKIVKRLNTTPGGLRCLSRQEIELYYRMPKDMKKVAPMLFLSALPMTNYIVFPLMYLFPRQLLCPHFWSLQQRTEFAIHSHRKRLYHNRPVFRALQAQLDSLEGHPLYCDWEKILGLLGSGVHPHPDEILKCIDLFRGEPYHLINIYSGHVKSLLQCHGMHTGFFRRRRLADRALIIRHMDLAMLREGGPQTLSQEELRWACFLRGLNPVNMRTDDMIEWLTCWLIVSQEIDKGSLSLLLHCPILLAYNHPTNWSLIY